MRASAIVAYFGLVSIPMCLRLSFFAAMHVVPDPRKGSSMTPFLGHPSFMRYAMSLTGFTVGWVLLVVWFFWWVLGDSFLCWLCLLFGG